MSNPQEEGPDIVRFRPSKKRKVYRQRDEPTESTEPDRDAEAGARPQHAAEQPDSTVTAAVKVRNARKARAGGVAFGGNPRPGDETSAEQALVLARGQDGGDAVIQGITNRFTHQTGLVSNLSDKHMTEYIESRLSRRPEPANSRDEPSSASTTNANTQQKSAPSGDASTGPTDPVISHPASQGRLMEVDLSEVAVGTRQAQERQRAQKKPRLGPDGKPWRGRKRRNSDDIKRDQLVEEFLHENRLDVYDTVPDANSASGTLEDDEGTTADDRLAEQFQRQYMDDMARRRQKKKPVQPGAPGTGGTAGGATEDVLKGPKLGGSRNARAAVRDALLKKEKEGKK